MFIPSAIKSIQYVNAVSDGSASYNTVISPVVIANSIIIPIGDQISTNAGIYSSTALIRWGFVDTTHVNTATSGATGNPGQIARAVVIEFYSGFIKSSGSASASFTNNVDTQKDYPLAAVNVNKTLLICLGLSCTTDAFIMGGNLGDDTEIVVKSAVTLISSTIIRAFWQFNINIANHPGGRVVYFNWIEFR